MIEIPFPSANEDLTSIVEHMPAIIKFRSRRSFETSALYSSLRMPIEQLTRAVTWSNTIHAKSKPHLRICAWNIERGKEIDGLLNFILHDHLLSKTDIFLLVETDLGMGRSGNRPIAKEMAEALQMNYCFGAAYIELTPGDIYERRESEKSTYALHGDAVLSRYPITGADLLPITVSHDKFHHYEKRLGEQKALIVRMQVGEQGVIGVPIHLDVHTSSAVRGQQLNDICHALASESVPVILGGDFNTGTYDLTSKWALTRNILHKFFYVGFEGAIRHYMTPEKIYEKPVFDILNHWGYDWTRTNDRSKGTFYYDMRDEALVSKTLQFVPGFALRYLNRKLRPWDGRVPLKMDWFAARNLASCTATYTIESPTWQGRRLSDHNPVVIDIMM